MTELTMALHAVNVILPLCLLYVYVQNYRKMKSKYAVGLILFAGLFLLQSLMESYYDFTMVMFSSTVAETASEVLDLIKAIGFAILLWISWE
jgi:hypothetical protein